MDTTTTIAFSAGGSVHGLSSHRVVRRRDLVAELARMLPSWSSALTAPPIIVNAYPAPMPCAGGVFVDTYLRPAAFLAAIRFASERDAPAIVLGQPILLAHMLVSARRRGIAFPQSIIAIVGGYQCPASLERFLRTRFQEIDAVIHAYGAAEVGAAVLVGRRPDPHASIVYSVADPLCRVVINDGRLGLVGGSEQAGDSSASRPDVFWTGDFAERQGDRIRVIPASSRLHPDVDALLESWTPEMWDRYTGAVAQRDHAWRIQLREGEHPMSSAEIEHFDFARDFRFSWLDKPDWSGRCSR